jgi:hypothetical protein
MRDIFDALFPPLFNGTLREHYLILFGSAGVIGFVFGLAGAWLGGYLGSRRRQRVVAQAVDPRLASAAEAQYIDLRRTLDSIAVEVERVAELQRFTARLVGDRLIERAKEPARLPEPASQPAKREISPITPH